MVNIIKKTKNTKRDLIWIIPLILIGLCIGVVAALHISMTAAVTNIGLSETIFHIVLSMMVLKIGFDMASKGFRELQEVFKNGKITMG